MLSLWKKNRRLKQGVSTALDSGSTLEMSQLGPLFSPITLTLPFPEEEGEEEEKKGKKRGGGRGRRRRGKGMKGKKKERKNNLYTLYKAQAAKKSRTKLKEENFTPSSPFYPKLGR